MFYEVFGFNASTADNIVIFGKHDQSELQSLKDLKALKPRSVYVSLGEAFITHIPYNCNPTNDPSPTHLWVHAKSYGESLAPGIKEKHAWLKVAGNEKFYVCSHHWDCCDTQGLQITQCPKSTTNLSGAERRADWKDEQSIQASMR